MDQFQPHSVAAEMDHSQIGAGEPGDGFRRPAADGPIVQDLEAEPFAIKTQGPLHVADLEGDVMNSGNHGGNVLAMGWWYWSVAQRHCRSVPLALQCFANLVNVPHRLSTWRFLLAENKHPPPRNLLETENVSHRGCLTDGYPTW